MEIRLVYWNNSILYCHNLPLYLLYMQVCNLAWSKSANELISTHGYSQNQIIIWRYPSLTQVAKLTGHTTRVLYLVSSRTHLVGHTLCSGTHNLGIRTLDIQCPE